MISVILSLGFAFMGTSSLQFHSYLFETMGFDPMTIGTLLMAGYGPAILSPILQSVALRWFGGPVRPLLLFLLLSALFLAALPHATGFYPVLALFFPYTFCMASVFPLISILSMDVVKTEDPGDYFKVRAAGTTGFFIGCAGSYMAAKYWDLTVIYTLFALCYLISFMILAWYHFQIENDKPQPASDASEQGEDNITYPSLRDALKKLADGSTPTLLLSLMLMSFAIFLSANIQGNYIIHQFAMKKEAISLSWIFATFFEIPFMFFCAWLLKKYGLSMVLLLGLTGSVLKLFGMAYAGTFGLFCLALMLHGAFFSGATTGIEVYLEKRHGREFRSVLQPVCGILYFGIPETVSAFLSGWLWKHYSLSVVLQSSFAFSILAFIIFIPVYIRIRKNEKFQQLVLIAKE